MLSVPAAVGVTAPVAALGLFLGWRTYLRLRLHWNPGGLVAISPRRTRRLAGTADTLVHDSAADVHLLADDGVMVEVPAPGRRWMRLLPAGPGEHDTTQLAHALRYARGQEPDLRPSNRYTLPNNGRSSRRELVLMIKTAPTCSHCSPPARASMRGLDE